MLSAEFGRSIANIMNLCEPYEESSGRDRLIALVCALYTGDPARLAHADELQLVSEKLGVFACEYGCVVYSQQDAYINANLCVPRKHGLANSLLAHFLAVFMHVNGITLNMHPLLTHLSPSEVPKDMLVIPSRFIESKASLGDVHRLNADRLTYMGRVCTCTSIRCNSPRLVQEIRHLRPLKVAMADPRTDLDERVWHKFDDAVCIFRNACYRPPTSMRLERVPSDSLHRGWVGRAIQPLSTDMAPALCVELLQGTRFPAQLWHLVAAHALTGATLTDAVVLAVGEHGYAPQLAETDDDVHIALMCRRAQQGSVRATYRFLCRAVDATRTRQHWAAWAASSSIVAGMVAAVSADKADALCRRMPCIRHVAARVRCAAPPPSPSPSPSPSSPSPSPSPQGDVGGACAPRDEQADDEGADGPRDEQADDYIELSRRMQRQFKLKVHLIGSGLFWRARDADVVLEVDTDASLADAYVIAATATSWTLRSCVDEVHPAVLRGVFEGVPVDAQVWRGASRVETDAERHTRRAMQLSASLETHVDTHLRRCVRILHAWAEVAGVKGHVYCRLPGIAVTIVAIAIGRRMFVDDGRVEGAVTLRRILERFSVRMRGTPIVSIRDDDRDDEYDRESDLRLPLCVLADDGANVATRMTLETSLFVHALVVRALSADARIMDAAYYREYMDARMFRCLHVRPRDEAVVARTLHVILRRLTGHPLIHALAASADASGSGWITVYVALRDGDGARYGFQSTRWQIAPRRGGSHGVGEYVRLVTPSRTCWLACTPRSAADRATRRSIGDVAEHAPTCEGIRVDAHFVVPNAPHLTTDVATRFADSEWALDVPK